MPLQKDGRYQIAPFMNLMSRVQSMTLPSVQALQQGCQASELHAACQPGHSNGLMTTGVLPLCTSSQDKFQVIG